MTVILAVLAFPAGAAAGALAVLGALRGCWGASFDEHAGQAMSVVSTPDDVLFAAMSAAMRAAEEAEPVKRAGRMAWPFRQQQRGGVS